MTDRKFTPPTKFPAEYVTRRGRKVEILGQAPDPEYPFVGWFVREDGDVGTSKWTKDGRYFSRSFDHDADLYDPPKKRVHWANDYASAGLSMLYGRWHGSRHQADALADSSRIAVIRREWVEGQPPQYFTEEV